MNNAWNDYILPLYINGSYMNILPSGDETTNEILEKVARICFILGIVLLIINGNQKWKVVCLLVFCFCVLYRDITDEGFSSTSEETIDEGIVINETGVNGLSLDNMSYEELESRQMNIDKIKENSKKEIYTDLDKLYSNRINDRNSLEMPDHDRNTSAKSIYKDSVRND